MTRQTFFTTFVCTFLGGMAIGTPGTVAQTASVVDPEMATDRTTLVVMAPAGPVFAEMNISVDGKAYRLWVTTFLAGRIDLNRDGALTLNELQLIPERLLQQTKAGDAKKALRQAAADKAADSVAVGKFAEWFAEQLSQSFNMIAGAVQPSEAVRMAALVDRNSDGSVSREELETGGRSLRFRDLDDDQTFTAAELLPFRDPRNQQAAVIPDAANLPFVQLGDAASVTRTVEQILKRYGTEQGVAPEILRLPEAAIGSVDANGDGLIAPAELQALLNAPVFHLVMDVQLSDRANASRLVLHIPDAVSGFCKATETGRGRQKLVIDDMPIDIRSRGGGGDSRGMMVNFLLQRMSLFDKDKNSYVTEEEYPELQQEMASRLQVGGQFADVDRNGDGMLLRNEVKEYIERDAVATQSRIEVSVKQDGKTLFKLLDANSDRRLTQRELREGFDVLQEYDVNQDEKLSESELGTAYSLQIGLGQADSLRIGSMQSMSMEARSTDAILPGVSGLEGPEWFRRMDRNQDRDVSYREFLGSRRIFETLDQDKDGLLSATEAEQLTTSEQ